MGLDLKIYINSSLRFCSRYEEIKQCTCLVPRLHYHNFLAIWNKIVIINYKEGVCFA